MYHKNICFTLVVLLMDKTVNDLTIMWLTGRKGVNASSIGGLKK